MAQTAPPGIPSPQAQRICNPTPRCFSPHRQRRPPVASCPVPHRHWSNRRQAVL